MTFATLAIPFALLCSLPLVLAELYVNHPLENDSCTGGQKCSVTWLDDGQAPLLTSIGPCTIGLYHGEQQLVQTIAPLDVSTTHSLDFTPNPQAGPNSDQYYISFTSLALKNSSNPSSTYQAFSTSFKLTGMSGSFAAPVPSLTSALPVPASVTSHPANTISGDTPPSASSAAPPPTATMPAQASGGGASQSSSAGSRGSGTPGTTTPAGTTSGTSSAASTLPTTGKGNGAVGAASRLGLAGSLLAMVAGFVVL